MKLSAFAFCCFFPFSSLASNELVIDRSSQSFHLIKSGTIVKTGPVSTGKRGHKTPSGQFVIHAKRANAWSNKYKAPMNYAMFFIGGKYAIHQGALPGYPASHGCVRVSKNDARFLFNQVSVGTKVFIK